MTALDTLGLTIRTLSLDGHEVAFVDEGAGPPILLLHGAPLTALGFVRVIRELAKHHRVLAPDLPGFGRTPAPPDFAGRLDDYADFVVRFVRALELERLVVFVNDASGSFGLAAAARVADRIAGIVVADTVQIPMTGVAWWVRQLLVHVVASRPMRAINRRFNLLPWMVATVAPWLRPFSRAERHVLTAVFDTPDKRDRVLDLFEQMGRDTAFIARTAEAARRHLADHPALLLYGAFDPMRWIGAVGRYRRMFPRHVVRIVAREEHFPILASGTEVGRLVHAWAAAEVARERAA